MESEIRAHDSADTKQSGWAYLKYIVYGSLALDTLLLGQFVTIGRDTLSASSSTRDPGLTFFDYGFPTVQVVICALALSIPCLALLSVRYTNLLPVLAHLPRLVEGLLFWLGVVSLGIALLATFWFFSAVAAAAFSAGLLIMLLAVAVSMANGLVKRWRR
ncbi:MAG TPA: hypothetical protein VGR57_00570 [Ktedonobacterales bacterium]|nr:hypothetical protein [Ktedonobacterales bacterium]